MNQPTFAIGSSIFFLYANGYQRKYYQGTVDSVKWDKESESFLYTLKNLDLKPFEISEDEIFSAIADLKTALGTDLDNDILNLDSCILKEKYRIDEFPSEASLVIFKLVFGIKDQKIFAGMILEKESAISQIVNEKYRLDSNSIESYFQYFDNTEIEINSATAKARILDAIT